MFAGCHTVLLAFLCLPITVRASAGIAPDAAPLHEPDVIEDRVTDGAAGKDADEAVKTAEHQQIANRNDAMRRLALKLHRRISLLDVQSGQLSEIAGPPVSGITGSLYIASFQAICSPDIVPAIGHYRDIVYFDPARKMWHVDTTESGSLRLTQRTTAVHEIGIEVSTRELPLVLRSLAEPIADHQVILIDASSHLAASRTATLIPSDRPIDSGIVQGIDGFPGGENIVIARPMSAGERQELRTIAEKKKVGLIDLACLALRQADIAARAGKAVQEINRDIPETSPTSRSTDGDNQFALSKEVYDEINEECDLLKSGKATLEDWLTLAAKHGRVVVTSIQELENRRVRVSTDVRYEGSERLEKNQNCAEAIVGLLSLEPERGSILPHTNVTDFSGGSAGWMWAFIMSSVFIACVLVGHRIYKFCRPNARE